MSTVQQIHVQSREPQLRHVVNRDPRLDEHLLRAMNKIKKPSTAEEITELLNRDLGPGERPFQTREVATWLRNADDKVLSLFWLENRPRRYPPIPVYKSSLGPHRRPDALDARS